MHRNILLLLKLIGIALFANLLIHIDRSALLGALRNADTLLMATGFGLTFGIYAAKAFRWQTLVRSIGVSLTYNAAWRMTNIGLALAVLTPAKIGEVGRAAYLRPLGVRTPIAVGLAVVDRLADACCIALLGVLALLDQSGWPAPIVGAVYCILLGTLLLSGRKLLRSRLARWMHRYIGARDIEYRNAMQIMLWTAAAWTLYFASTVLLARSIGITTATPHLIAALIIAGLVSLVPIAPSGLGTRDATLIALLVPQGEEPSRVVALGVIMFCTIVLSSIPGLIYWLQTRTPHDNTVIDVGEDRP